MSLAGPDFSTLGIIDEHPLIPGTAFGRSNDVEIACYHEILIGWRGPTIKQIRHRNVQISNKKRKKWHRHIIVVGRVLEPRFRLLGMDQHADCIKLVVGQVNFRLLPK